MLEWLKRHVWKACDRPKRFQGSNPCLSAMKRKLILALLAVAAVFVSCGNPDPIDDTQYLSFDVARASYYGDYYGNGCSNYILKLVHGRYDDQQNLVGPGLVLTLDLNLPASNVLGINSGNYKPLYSGTAPEFTFVRGGTSGNGELIGSYLLRFYGNEENGEAHEITDGKIRVAYSGNMFVLDALLFIDGVRYSISYRGELYIYDETFHVPTDPVLTTLNSAEAVNYGRYYDSVYADMWFIRLYDTYYETTGESVEIEVLTPVGLATLPYGSYPVVDDLIDTGYAVYGWIDDDEYVHGTWYCYDGSAWYGATTGKVNISRRNSVSLDYVIEFDCYDKIEDNSFKGRYTGPVTILSPTEMALSKSGGRKTGDVLVSTALTRKGKHVGSCRVAR